jgi:Fe-S cluster biogenesis protein NfuA
MPHCELVFIKVIYSAGACASCNIQQHTLHSKLEQRAHYYHSTTSAVCASTGLLSIAAQQQQLDSLVV